MAKKRQQEIYLNVMNRGRVPFLQEGFYRVNVTKVEIRGGNINVLLRIVDEIPQVVVKGGLENGNQA